MGRANRRVTSVASADRDRVAAARDLPAPVWAAKRDAVTGDAAQDDARQGQAARAALQRALDAVLEQPGAVRLGARLARSQTMIETDIAMAVREQIPAFGESRNTEVPAQWAKHAPDHLAEIIRLLDGGGVGDFAFVRDHARLRAAQYFPLEAVLHAYRCTLKVITRHLLSMNDQLSPAALALLADFTLEYADAISTIMSAEYVAQVRRLACAAVDEQAALLGLLLGGYDESDRRASERLRKAGFLDGRQAFCVVLAQSVDPAHMSDAARARRMADALDELLPATELRRLTGVRGGRVTIVLAALRRVSGWSAPFPALSGRAATRLAVAGNDVLIGISQDVHATARIPAAHRQAGLALQLAHVGERVRRFDDLALRDLMLHEAVPALSDILPAWHRPFDEADRRLDGALLATLRTLAACDLNVSRAALALGAHPNTLYARFERIRAITGLDPRSYHGLDALLLVIDAARVPKAG